MQLHSAPGSMDIGTEDIIVQTPTQWVKNVVKVPVQDPVRKVTEIVAFSFKGREFWKRIYDTGAERVLLMCGRQVNKSTYLGNNALTYSTLRRYFRTLYVSSAQAQSETFSRDRLEEPIEISPVLHAYTQGAGTKDNVLLKRFITGSSITLRYAYNNANRTRGIPCDQLLLDELQDLHLDLIPVIEETLFSSSFDFRRYAGTPLSRDNTIAWFWENFSNQCEWVIPCDRCGSKVLGGPGRYWNVAGPKSIQKHGLSCIKCGNRIDPLHPDAQWASFYTPRTAKPFEGYRIPQIICPWADWGGIMDKLSRYPPRRFYNEVLALGYDFGDRPLTERHIRACCGEKHMFKGARPEVRRSRTTKYYMGIDWGTGESQSFTVVTVGAYINSRFEVVYAHRFEGEEADPEFTMNSIFRLIEKYRPSYVGADYGGGYDRNKQLVKNKNVGIRRLLRYQYDNTKKKVKWSKDRGLYDVRRNEVLKDLIHFIKKGNEFRFPSFETFFDPHGKDMTNVLCEFSDRRNEELVSKTPGSSDDSLHSLLYCFLASMVDYPRPDFLHDGVDRP